MGSRATVGQTVILKYQPLNAALATLVGLAFSAASLVAIYMNSGRYLEGHSERHPLIIVAILAAIWFAWMCGRVLSRVMFHDGAAAWISEGELKTALWSVRLSEIEEMTYTDHLRFQLKGGRRKYISGFLIKAGGDDIAASVGKAIAAAQGVTGP